MFLHRKVLVVSVLQSANVMMATQQMHFTSRTLPALWIFQIQQRCTSHCSILVIFLTNFFLSVLVKWALGQQCSSSLTGKLSCEIISMNLKDVSKQRLKLTITVEKESMVPKQCMVLV